MNGGLAAATATALITEGTLPTQRAMTLSLADLAALPRDIPIDGPSIIVVGDVVRYRDVLANRAEVAERNYG